MIETVTQRAYRLSNEGDEKSALAVILDETEKLISLNLICVAKQFANSIDIDKIILAKYAHRFMALRDK